MRGRATEAQLLDASRAEKLEQYEAVLRAARAEGYQLLEAEKNAAMLDREQRLSAAKEEISKEVASAVHATQQQQAAAHGDLEATAAELSGLIEAQILKRPRL